MVFSLKKWAWILYEKKVYKSLHNSKSHSIFAPHLRENVFPPKSLEVWVSG